MRVEVYSNTYRDDVTTLIYEYFKETAETEFIGTYNTAYSFLDDIATKGYFIYIVLDGDEVVGFTILYISDMYGFCNKYLIVDHMYVLPQYRRTKATLWLYATIGKVMIDLDIDGVGTTYTDCGNKRNNQLVGGKVIAEVTKVTRKGVENIYNKYKKGLHLTV